MTTTNTFFDPRGEEFAAWVEKNFEVYMQELKSKCDKEQADTLDLLSAFYESLDKKRQLEAKAEILGRYLLEVVEELKKSEVDF